MKFALFSVSAGAIQVVSFSLMEEVFHFVVFGDSIDSAKTKE